MIIFAFTSLIAVTTFANATPKECVVKLSKVRSILFEVVPAGICNDLGYNRVSGAARAIGTNVTSRGTNTFDVCVFVKTIEDVLPSLSKKAKTSLVELIIACSKSLVFCNDSNQHHIGTCAGTVATRLAKDFTKDLKKNCAKVNEGLKSISGSDGASKLQNLISKNVESCNFDSTVYSFPCEPFPLNGCNPGEDP